MPRVRSTPAEHPGIRVWEHSCQLIGKAGGDWSAIGPRWDLPVQVPRNAEEPEAAAEPLRLTAHQYCAECPGSGIAEVLNKTRPFSAALKAPVEGMPGARLPH